MEVNDLNGSDEEDIPLKIGPILLRRDWKSIRSIVNSWTSLSCAEPNDSNIERILRFHSVSCRRSAEEEMAVVLRREKKFVLETNLKRILEDVDQLLGVARGVAEEIFAEFGVDSFQFLTEIVTDQRTVHLQLVRTGRGRVNQLERSGFVDPISQQIQLFLTERGEGISREEEERRTSMRKTCFPSDICFIWLGVHWRQ